MTDDTSLTHERAAVPEGANTPAMIKQGLRRLCVFWSRGYDEETEVSNES